MSGFTETQERAMTVRGNVLVVAGAGTGKTRTLVGRAVRWLLERPGENSLDQLLIVTFTDAAAAELRQRIRDALNEELQRHPEFQWLREQIVLLETAFISTLHSFCFRLVRQHFFDLELDPQVTVLAAEEAQLLAEETLTGLLEKHYSGKSGQAASVRRLIQKLGRGWDRPVRQLVMNLHEYAQTLPDPSGWFSGQLALFSTEPPAVWRSWLEGSLKEWSDGWIPVLETTGAPIANIQHCLAALRELASEPTIEKLRKVLEQIEAADSAPWPRGSKKNVRDELKDFFREAATFQDFVCPADLPQDLPGSSAAESGAGAESSTDPLTQDWQWVREHMTVLLELALEFGREFALAKRELGMVDFHDLEQHSLRLLWDASSRSATPLAKEWQQQLQLIFVDEYQDINAAQDLILRALAREGARANRFLVGDPKQSIYRFRRADPHIFQEYIETWKRSPSEGAVLPLIENFRSHGAILSFINELFSALMRSELGGIAYDASAQLQFGSPATRAQLFSNAHGGAVPVELHLQLTGEDEDQAEDSSEEAAGTERSKPEAEARMAGMRLAELRQQKRLVWDAETNSRRPVEWRDMVVLLRSPRAKAEAYAKEFAQLGIPLITNRSGFFSALEVTDVLSVLQLLDNPLQDLPLLTVLHSPFVSLGLNELALIRLAAKGQYWTALQRFQQLLASPDSAAGRSLPERLESVLRDPALRDVACSASAKARSFLQQFAKWRQTVRQSSLAECLEEILEDTQYLSFLKTQANGQQQCGNVQKLLHWARQFDRFQRQGLFRFLKFIEAQKEAEIDHEPAPVETENAVRLMSIHQSKGLEFSVVLVADLGKPFNLLDLKGDVILDPQLGLCPQVKPPFTEQRYPSVAYWLAQRRQRRETYGEEMRLLYVAMTRACDLLLLAGTASRKTVKRWAKQEAVQPTSRQLLLAKNPLDWIGPWMAQAAGRSDWAEGAVGQSALLQWFIHEQGDDLGAAPSDRASQPETLQSASWQSLDPAKAHSLVERLNWKYPFTLATEQLAKASVSAIRIGLSEGGVRRRPRFPESSPKETKEAAPGPKSTLRASEVGVAHHTFLQFLHLDAASSMVQLESEAARMEANGTLTSLERASLDLDAILGFWHSELGSRILHHREAVHREMPFTMKMSLRELREFERVYGRANAGERDSSGAAASGPGQGAEGSVESSGFPDREFVIITGVLDLVMLNEAEIWLVDFKTDSALPGQWKQKLAEYSPQMTLYALALRRIYDRPVTAAYLHSFALRESFRCDLPAVFKSSA